MEKVTVMIKRSSGNEDLPVPRYMSPNAAGMDLYAAVKEDTTLRPGEIRLIPTGIIIALPTGFEAQVRPRSGLAIKHGIGILNSPGTIDPDYRGEVRIILINMGENPFIIKRGDRIAQMIINKVYHAHLELSSELSPTERNDGGFGHTGR
jgi:dUTP pyrophosphatase